MKNPVLYSDLETLNKVVTALSSLHAHLVFHDSTIYNKVGITNLPLRLSLSDQISILQEFINSYKH